MKKEKFNKEQLKTLADVNQTKTMWYLSAAEEIYKSYPGIRLTDAQLAKLLVKEYGGTEASHTAKIRQTRCNDKSQDYVNKSL